MKRSWKYKAYLCVRAGRGSGWPSGFHWSSEVKPNSDPASLWAAWFTDTNDGLFFLSALKSSSDGMAKVRPLPVPFTLNLWPTCFFCFFNLGFIFWEFCCTGASNSVDWLINLFVCLFVYVLWGGVHLNTLWAKIDFMETHYFSMNLFVNSFFLFFIYP